VKVEALQILYPRDPHVRQTPLRLGEDKEEPLRKLVLLLAAIGALMGILVLPTHADEKTVNATVTAKVIAVTVNTNSLVYGSLAVGTSDNVPNPTNVLVTNSGNVVEDFKIRGAASTPAGWTLTSTTPGADTYRHKFDTSGAGSFASFLSTSNAVLFNDVAGAGSINAYFKLDMPSSSSSFAQQTLPIIIAGLESTASGPN
jgi:hypothetical protein